MKKNKFFLLLMVCVGMSYQAQSQTVTGTGTINYVPKFTGTSTIGNSLIQDNGSKVFVNGATDDGFSQLLLNGTGNFSGNPNFNASNHIIGNYFQTSIFGTYANQTNQYLNEDIGVSFGLHGTGSTVLQTFPGMNAVGSSIYKTNTGNITGFVSSFRTNYLFSNSGSITDVASFYGGFPLQQSGQPSFTGTITNFYGLYLSDVTTNSNIQSKITNKWGIYQLGASDKNYLNGNTLIGTSIDGGYKLSVAGTANVSSTLTASSIGVNGASGNYKLKVSGTSNFTDTLSGTKANFSGSVGIGTTNPGPYALAVEGTIGARKVKVTSSNPWADYVFEKDYPLLPLEQVESYINIHKHLPDIPSAREVAEKGIDVGETATVLLKKIEELTLYLIEMKKDNEILKRTIDEIKKGKN